MIFNPNPAVDAFMFTNAKYLVLLITVLSGMWWQNTVDNSRKKLLESRVKMKLPRFCKKVL